MNFSPRAQLAFASARSEADRLGHFAIGPEHLLLSILKLNQGTAVRVLLGLGVDPMAVKLDIETRVAGEQVGPVAGASPYTQQAKQVLALAERESQFLQSGFLGTEHILLGLLRENFNTAAQVLQFHGVEMDKVLSELTDVCDDSALPGAQPVFLDVEIQRRVDEVGGWLHLDKVGVAVAVAFLPMSHQLRIFTETNLAELSALLNQASEVIGYNIIEFDAKVLKGYPEVDLERVAFRDLMKEIAEAVGHRVPLSNLRASTLGHSPDLDGLDLIEFWKAGDRERVIEGCCNDVLAMSALYDYGVRHGELLFQHRDRVAPEKIKVDWSPIRQPQLL